MIAEYAAVNAKAIFDECMLDAGVRCSYKQFIEGEKDDPPKLKPDQQVEAGNY